MGGFKMLKHKRRIISFLLIMTMALSLFLVWDISSVVYAEVLTAEDTKTVSVTVRIEGHDRTIVPRTKIYVPKDEGPYTIHAIIKALEAEGKNPEDPKVFDAIADGNFITCVDGIRSTDSSGWMYSINNEFAPVGVAESILEDGDDIVLYFVEDYSKTTYTFFDKSNVTTSKGEEVALTLLDDESVGVLGAQILVNDEPLIIDGEDVITDEDGKATLQFDKPGEYHISAARFDEDNNVINISRPYCKIVVAENSEILDEAVVSEKPADPEVLDNPGESPLSEEPVDLEEPEGSKNSKLDETIEKTYNYYRKNKTNLTSWWEIVALTAAGEDVTKTPWKLPKWKSSDLEKDSPAVYYPEYILGLMAQGEDPTNIWGRNLVEELRTKQQGNGAFGAINSHIWAIIALDAANADYNVEAAIQHLISQQKNDGGYAWGEDNTPEEPGDPDMTGMALVALANHRDIDGVEATIARSLNYLRESQLSTGGFASWGTDNANSVATVISGLVAVREDVLSDDWIKDGSTMLDALQRFQQEDGSFAYGLAPENLKYKATDQAFIALNDLKNQKSIWHTLSISHKKPNERDDEEPISHPKEQERSEETEKLMKKEGSKDREKLEVAKEDREVKHGAEEEKVKSPKTGDRGINNYIILAILSMSTAIYLLINKKIAKQR